jgi:hypothetical protein
MVPSGMRELVVVFRRNLQLTPIMGSRHILCFRVRRHILCSNRSWDIAIVYEQMTFE